MNLAGHHPHDPHFVDGTVADHPPELIALVLQLMSWRKNRIWK